VASTHSKPRPVAVGDRERSQTLTTASGGGSEEASTNVQRGVGDRRTVVLGQRDKRQVQESPVATDAVAGPRQPTTGSVIVEGRQAESATSSS